jgi:hypothetical protein
MSWQRKTVLLELQLYVIQSSKLEIKTELNYNFKKNKHN